jgi:hypothetical protein
MQWTWRHPQVDYRYMCGHACAAMQKTAHPWKNGAGGERAAIESRPPQPGSGKPKGVPTPPESRLIAVCATGAILLINISLNLEGSPGPQSCCNTAGPGRSEKGRDHSTLAPRSQHAGAAPLSPRRPARRVVGGRGPGRRRATVPRGGRSRRSPKGRAALPHRNQQEALSRHQVKGCAHQQHCMVPRHCYNLGFFALSAGVSGAPRCGHPAVESLSAWPGSLPAGGRSHEAASQLKGRRALEAARQT